MFHKLRNKRFWILVFVQFIIYFLIYGLVQFAMRDRTEPLVASAMLTEVLVWSVCMTFTMTLLDKNSRESILGAEANPDVIKKRSPAHYINLALFITLLCCLLAYPFLFLGHFIFYVTKIQSTLIPRHLISPVIMFLLLSALFISWQYFKDRKLVRRETGKRG